MGSAHGRSEARQPWERRTWTPKFRRLLADVHSDDGPKRSLVPAVGRTALSFRRGRCGANVPVAARGANLLGPVQREAECARGRLTSSRSTRVERHSSRRQRPEAHVTGAARLGARRNTRTASRASRRSHGCAPTVAAVVPGGVVVGGRVGAGVGVGHGRIWPGGPTGVPGGKMFAGALPSSSSGGAGGRRVAAAGADRRRGAVRVSSHPERAQVLCQSSTRTILGVSIRMMSVCSVSL